MNRKQVIVGWGMIISISIAFAYVIITMPNDPAVGLIVFYKSLTFILIIGGLLIYTLRDKQK